jgi:anion-transporting  ArsA/GET3 family ATPase
VLRAGGVGKTTTAAAIALRAAEYGRTVVVLTIDPAKRLAQALGIKDLGNEPQQVPLGNGSGELHAMMLDMRRTFDEMVLEHSDPERAQAILDNQFYQTVATSLAGTQEVHGDGRSWPAAGPGPLGPGGGGHPAVAQRAGLRTRRNGSAASWTAAVALLLPRHAGHRRVGLAMKAMSTILGSQMLSDASAFVQSLDSTFGGFREGRPHLRTAQAARHPVRGGVGRRTGRPARGVLLRRPAVREGMPLAG